ncbi:hypothetical protein FRB96_003019 [Tulasnella sp. 330]|nr:hypothetical protein FRB96_003019 [Tulasnella sp. 330]KAG8876347.1 hypothetical protein FRB97_004286 [Tulasnella sp. 331]KAG8878577.1 hypothetical protein FRB98_006090 [Tulasnella sp. 332]
MHEFTSELFAVNWARFGRYAGYIRSINYEQNDHFRGHQGIPSDRAWADMFLHRPTSNGSTFPNLTRVQWTVTTEEALPQLLLFLVPTVTSLLLSCRRPLMGGCVKILKVLNLRNILLTELRIAMGTHTQAFLESLSEVLADQRRLIRVGLPHYSASREVVAALATLPVLEEYVLWSFFNYQVPLGIGMEFDWDAGGFATLKTFALFTSLKDAAKVMARPHQPPLNNFTLISREFLQHAHLRNLCSSLSVVQPSLNVVYLSLYSGTVGLDPSWQVISFDLIRPLLLCTALRELCIRSDMAMAYNNEDITSMVSAWPRLQTLSLCADPVSDVGLTTGQPLRSVGSFAYGFRVLRELSIYLNTLDTDVTPRVSTGPLPSRLSMLDFGTSPVPTDSMGTHDPSRAIYVASLLQPRALIKSERSHAHRRFLQTSATVRAEYYRRQRFWSGFASEVQHILSGTTDLTHEIAVPPR